MNHLQLIRLGRRATQPESPNIGIDVYDEDGDLHLCEANLDLVRRVLEATDHNLVRIQIGDASDEEIALVCDWPFHWRSGKVSLQLVSADDEVAAYARISMPSALAGAYRAVDPWIHLRGKAKDVVQPVDLEETLAGKLAIYAADLSEFSNCRLVSPPGQCLFERVGQMKVAAHA